MEAVVLRKMWCLQCSTINNKGQTLKERVTSIVIWFPIMLNHCQRTTCHSVSAQRWWCAFHNACDYIVLWWHFHVWQRCLLSYCVWLWLVLNLSLHVSLSCQNKFYCLQCAYYEASISTQHSVCEHIKRVWNDGHSIQEWSDVMKKLKTLLLN